MALLFVSRARFEEVVRERDALREENKRLLDRVVMGLGGRPVFSAVLEETKAAAPEVKKESGDAPMLRNRPTLEKVKGMAEASARDKSPTTERRRPITP
jgi:hypothetical protein